MARGVRANRMTRKDFDNYTFQQINPEPDRRLKEKSNTRRFWFLSLPLGAGFGLLAIVLTSEVNSFWPVWLIATVLLQAMLEGK